MFDSQTISMLYDGLRGTLYMTLVSTALAYIVGLPLGIILVVTDKNGIKPAPVFNSILGAVINLVRSVPFIILIVLIFPVTRAIIGTGIGSTATIVPLFFASAPYVARLVESSMKEVDPGMIEAAKSMGASTMQIVRKVMIPESVPSLLVGSAICVTTILGYSAMAGAVGGGGLGDIAIQYGHNRNQRDILYMSVAILVIVVQVLQEVGMRLARHTDKRN